MKSSWKMRRNRLAEIWATLRGALFLFFTFGSLFIIFGVISLGRIFEFGAHTAFRVGNTEIPKWQGAGATNIGIFIFCVAGLIAVALAIYLRYRQHQGKIQLLREKGITDFDGDGKVDSFADRFLDDL